MRKLDVVVKTEIADQEGAKPDGEENLRENFAKVLVIVESTDISLIKCVKEINPDAELKALCQANKGKNFRSIPSSYKFFQSYLKDDLGLVVVAKKLATGSLREWFKRVFCCISNSYTFIFRIAQNRSVGRTCGQFGG